MKILFWLAKNKRSKQGYVPIYCRITISGKRSEIATNIYIPEADFDKRHKKVRPGNKNAEAYNKQLFKLNATLTNLYHNQIFFEECQPTATHLKQLYENQFYNRKRDIQSVMIELAEKKFESTKRPISYEKDKRYAQIVMRALKEMRQASANIDDFTTELFDELTHHLIKSQGYSIGYTKKTISYLKSALIYAYNRKYTNRYPVSYKFPLSETKEVVYLNESEIQRLRNHTFEYPALYRVRDCFLIQCYTGLAYADLKRLNSNNIRIEEDGLWIDIVRQKVKTAQCYIPIIGNALEILKKYDFELPVLSNQRYNEHLKRIARFMNFPIELTSHVGRKSFGTLMLNKGVPIETVSALLGHSNVKMTQKHYVKVLHSKIAQDIRIIM